MNEVHNNMTGIFQNTDALEDVIVELLSIKRFLNNLANFVINCFGSTYNKKTIMQSYQFVQLPPTSHDVKTADLKKSFSQLYSHTFTTTTFF